MALPVSCRPRQAISREAVIRQADHPRLIRRVSASGDYAPNADGRQREPRIRWICALSAPNSQSEFFSAIQPNARNKPEIHPIPTATDRLGTAN
jgi:hypothetical protein